MDWEETKKKIEININVSTNINTKQSKYRIIESTNTPITSRRYNYQNEFGFVVTIGKNNKIKIPWSVLRECFLQAGRPEGYDGNFF